MQPAVRPRGRTRRLNGLAQIRAIVHDTERPVGLVTALQTCGERAGIAVEHHGHHIARLHTTNAIYIRIRRMAGKAKNLIIM